MALPEQANVSDLRVLWVSHGYGYHGDLMYFGEIFRSFRQLLPEMSVVVDTDTTFRNGYSISLLPLLKRLRVPLRRKAPDGQVYETEIALPSPAFPVRLARQKADALIAIEFTPAALMAALVASLSRRCKLVLLVESDPARRGGSKSLPITLLKRWAVRRAQVIQTNNDHGRRYLVEDLKTPAERVRVAPYLTSRPPGQSDLRAAPDGHVRLLFANSINPRKGLRQLIAAIATLAPDIREQLSFTVVGDGEEREELEALARETLGLGDRLHFVGRKSYDELGAYYGKADILAVPSLADYRSLAGFEGLGYGLALLASPHDGATEETVIEGVTGYAIDPFDTQTLAARLRDLIADRSLLQAMREGAARCYSEQFSLEIVAQNLAESIAIATTR